MCIICESCPVLKSKGLRREAEHRCQLGRAEISQVILFQLHQLLGGTATEEVDELEHFPSGLKPASFHAPKSGEERKV